MQLISIVLPIAIAMHTRTLRRTRPGLCAPQFWPANVVIDTPNALSAIHTILSTLPKAVQAAMVSVPSAFMLACIIRLDTAKTVDCSPAGKPMRSTRTMSPMSSRSCRGTKR